MNTLYIVGGIALLVLVLSFVFSGLASARIVAAIVFASILVIWLIRQIA
jgi:hypothetical protein